MACNVQFAKFERSIKESDLELCLESDYLACEATPVLLLSPPMVCALDRSKT